MTRLAATIHQRSRPPTSSTPSNARKSAAALTPYGRAQAAQQLPAYWGEQPYTGGPTYLGAAATGPSSEKARAESLPMKSGISRFQLSARP